MKDNEDKLLEEMVLTRVLRLDAIITGATTGLLFGLGFFLVTIFLVLKGGPVVGPHLGLLGVYLPGYDVTVLGSFIGLVYGLILGFITGVLITVIYNQVAGSREARRERKKQG